jgi:hypothetical protein
MAASVTFTVREFSVWPFAGLAVAGGAVLALANGRLWLVAGALVALAAIVAGRLRPKGLVLIVDADGFDDRRLGIGRVMWHHVAGLERVTFRRMPYVNVHLTPSGRDAVALPPWRHWTAPLLRLEGLAPVHIALLFFDATPDRVFAALADAYSRRGGAPPPLG